MPHDYGHNLLRTSLVFTTPPLHGEGVSLLLLVLGYILIKQLSILLLRGLNAFQINGTLGIIIE